MPSISKSSCQAPVIGHRTDEVHIVCTNKLLNNTFFSFVASGTFAHLNAFCIICRSSCYFPFTPCVAESTCCIANIRVSTITSISGVTICCTSRWCYNCAVIVSGSGNYFCIRNTTNAIIGLNTVFCTSSRSCYFRSVRVCMSGIENGDNFCFYVTASTAFAML